MEVEHKEIGGFPGYRVGNDGTVWSCRRGEWILLKVDCDRKGYARVWLMARGAAQRKRVSHLVLEAFSGPRPDGMEACHDPDPSRSNNAASNLRWDTPANNEKDKIKHGRVCIGGKVSELVQARGEKHGRRKLTDQQVIEIRRLHASGETCSTLATQFSVGITAILKIVNRQRWTHI